jgi:hypothetical protein
MMFTKNALESNYLLTNGVALSSQARRRLHAKTSRSKRGVIPDLTLVRCSSLFFEAIIGSEDGLLLMCEATKQTRRRRASIRVR